jgi:RHS repeat-associated protein
MKHRPDFERRPSRVLCAVVMSLAAAQAIAQSGGAGPMTWTYEYDANGNLTRVIDPVKAVTDRNLDSLQRIYRTTQPVPKPGASRPKIDQRYDGLDQPSAVIDPRNLKTVYTTTGLGDVTDLSSPDSGADQLTHDAAGNIKTRRDARGKTTTYSYDALNRLTLADYASGIDSQWEYDGGSDNPPPAFSQGRLTKLTDESGTTGYSWDGYGRVLSKRQTTAVGSLAFKIGYAWGTGGAATGKLQSLTYPSQARVELAYDSATKRLAKIVVYPVNANGSGTSDKPVTLISQIGYNAWNEPANWRWGDGRSYSRSWDAFARPKAYPLGDADGKGLAEGAQRKLDYDDAGRITAYTHFNAGMPQTKLDQSFDYDGLGRLTQATSTATVRSYGWDDSGNRSAQSSSGSNYTHSVSKTSNRYDEVQVPASTGVVKRAPQYDEAGHLKASGSGGLPIAYTASYSDRGRMDSLTSATGKVSYRYNALEQRISKSGPERAVPGGAVHYVYDEQGHVLGEYDAKGNPLYEVVWLNDQPLAVIRQSRSNAGGSLKVTTDVDYIYADHLDTPRLIVRASGDHAIVWRWDIPEPFGNAPADDNPNKLGRYRFNLRLPGQVFDSESALHYNHHRDYDAYLGRYTTPDPLGLGGGDVGLYNYALNQPTKYTDPSGLFLPALAIPFLGGTIGFGELGIGFGLAALMTIPGDTSPADRAGQSAERKAYKRRCTEPPPPSLTGCDLLRWLLQRNKDCKNMREDYARKWFGDNEPNHAAEIANYATAIRRLEEEIAQKCCGK